MIAMQWNAGNLLIVGCIAYAVVAEVIILMCWKKLYFKRLYIRLKNSFQ